MIDDISLSPLKREKLRNEAKKTKKIEMRALLPILTSNDIRRHRIPYHEALIAELNEDGYVQSAYFLQNLVYHQEKYMQPYSIITKTSSKLCKLDFEKLYEYLKTSEQAYQKKNFPKELEILLEITVSYAFGPSGYWWLGEQLILKCLRISDILDDRSRGNAFSTYIYGKFLLENVKNKELAEEYLDKSRTLAADRHWNASKIFGATQETIFVESCILLYKIYLAKANEIVKKDPEMALHFCNSAKTKAKEACYHDGEFQALLLKGQCELLMKNTSSATVTFNKMLIKETRRNSAQGICEAKLQLAKALVQHGSSQAALKHFEQLADYAKEQKMSSYVGQTYKAMGQYYLSKNEPQKATPILLEAFQIFHSENDINNREEARTLAAVSSGQEMLGQYTELIGKSDKSKNSEFYLMKLARWKDCREKFWDNSETRFSDLSFLSYENILGSNEAGLANSPKSSIKDLKRNEETQSVEGKINSANIRSYSKNDSESYNEAVSFGE